MVRLSTERIFMILKEEILYSWEMIEVGIELAERIKK